MSIFRAQAAGLLALPAALERQSVAVTDADLFELDIALAEAAEAVSARLAIRFPDPKARAFEGVSHFYRFILAPQNKGYAA